MNLTTSNLYDDKLELVRKQIKGYGIDVDSHGSDLETSDFSKYSSGLTIYPSDKMELQEVVALLNQSVMPFHVVSRGHNWGYGDINLNGTVNVLIHLRHLDKIIQYDDQLGTVVIEPGVSQGQLESFLKAQNSEWVIDVTGSDRHSSIVGNFLERGFGHTSHGDHESVSKVIEAMTPEGKFFCPNVMSAGNSKVRGLYQHDMGLNLEKVFYQTNFAIVTELMVRLKPRNQKTCFCLIFFANDEAVASGLKEIGRLKGSSVLSAIPHIANMGRIQKTTESKVALAADWVGTVDVSGPPEMVSARIRVLKKTFPKEKIVVFTEKRLKLLEFIARIFPARFALKNQVANLNLLRNLFSGVPVDGFVKKSLYSEDGIQRKMNWLCPIFPVSENHFQTVKAIVKDEFEKHGFKYSATLSLINDKSSVMITEIFVEGNDVERLKAAEACYRMCHDRLLEAGYPFYRYGLQNGKLAYSWMKRSPEYLRAYEALKNHFDPNHVMSTGRWGMNKPQV